LKVQPFAITGHAGRSGFHQTVHRSNRQLPHLQLLTYTFQIPTYTLTYTFADSFGCKRLALSGKARKTKAIRKFAGCWLRLMEVELADYLSATF